MCEKHRPGPGGIQTSAFVDVQNVPEKKDHCARFIHEDLFPLHIAGTSVAARKLKEYYNGDGTVERRCVYGKQIESQHSGQCCHNPSYFCFVYDLLFRTNDSEIKICIWACSL